MPAVPLLPDLDWQLEDYTRALRLHKGLILLCTFLFGGFTAFTMARKPDIYQATTRVLIETEPIRTVRFQEVNPYPSTGGWIQGFLQTEYRVISSRAVAAGVIEQLHLNTLHPFSLAKDPVKVLNAMVAVDPVRGTKLVDISATNAKAELAAQIANAMADAYARLNLERRQAIAIGGGEWLKEEVMKMGEKSLTSQQALQKFREQHRDVDFSQEQQGTLLQRLRELTTAITETKKQRIEAEIKYREKHPVLLELQAKEQELLQVLQEQEGRAAELNRLSFQHDVLLRDLKTNEGIHNALLMRSKELSIAEGLESNNVQIVDHALVPEKPIGPPRQRITLLASVMGFLCGISLSLLREALAKTIRTRREFEHVLGIPFLGRVPLLRPGKKRHRNEAPLLLTEPNSNAAESIRSIRTTLEFLLPADRSHTLLVTSALPEEGKSVISLNVAIALRELGRKAILVDADLRRPAIHRLSNLKLRPGLSDHLQGEVELEKLVQLAGAGLSLPVISAGSPTSYPADILVGPRMRELLDRLKQDYQYVLIDTPPVLAVADTTALARFTDGILYVVWDGQTHRDVALTGKQRLVDVGSKIIGGILNKSQLELERGYRYYYYYRGEGSKRFRDKKKEETSSPSTEIPPASPESG